MKNIGLKIENLIIVRVPSPGTRSSLAPRILRYKGYKWRRWPVTNLEAKIKDAVDNLHKYLERLLASGEASPETMIEICVCSCVFEQICGKPSSNFRKFSDIWQFRN